MRNDSIARRLASQMWGSDIQSQRKCDDGIWFFTTDSHGGYIVDTQIRPELTAFNCTVYLRRDSDYYNFEEQHFAPFEEDCMAAIVEWTYPEIIPKLMKHFIVPEEMTMDVWVRERLEILKCSLEQWNPEYLKKYPEPGHKAFALPQITGEMKYA